MTNTDIFVFVIILATILIDFLGSFNFDEAVRNFQKRVKNDFELVGVVYG